MPIDEHRRAEITAAVGAYNTANPDAPLPRNTARLLVAMFPAKDVCQRTVEDLTEEGFNRKSLSRTLGRLLEAGFLTKQPGAGHEPNTYQLHLPPLVRP